MTLVEIRKKRNAMSKGVLQPHYSEKSHVFSSKVTTFSVAYKFWYFKKQPKVLFLRNFKPVSIENITNGAVW